MYFFQFEKSQIHKTLLKWHLSCYIGIFDVKKFVFSDIPRAKRMCYWKVRPPPPLLQKIEMMTVIGTSLRISMSWIESKTGTKGNFQGEYGTTFDQILLLNADLIMSTSVQNSIKKFEIQICVIHRISNIARSSITQKVIIFFNVSNEIHPHIQRKPNNFPAFESNVLRTFIVAVPVYRG